MNGNQFRMLPQRCGQGQMNWRRDAQGKVRRQQPNIEPRDQQKHR
jgi:hypothetical protein